MIITFSTLNQMEGSPCVNEFYIHYVIMRFMMVYQIGKTKVFLRAGQMAELDARRAEVLGNAARVIQRQIRTHIARKEFIELRRAAICLQSNLRGIVIPYFSLICFLCFLLLLCLVVHYLNRMFGMN